jgi:hypothetical protein
MELGCLKGEYCNCIMMNVGIGVKRFQHPEMRF